MHFWATIPVMAEEQEVSTMEQSVEEAGDEVVTLQEVLQQEQQLMDDATAVLGASDDTNCTYNKVIDGNCGFGGVF